jgi:hypothetical protein
MAARANTINIDARPLVEYASIAWNPYTKTEINKIEAAQRRAARYVVNNQRNRSAMTLDCAF